MRLFRGGETDEHAILVELRRMSGCSLIFGEEYRAIVRVVQSGTVVAKETADVERRKLDQEDFPLPTPRTSSNEASCA